MQSTPRRSDRLTQEHAQKTTDKRQKPSVYDDFARQDDWQPPRKLYQEQPPQKKNHPILWGTVCLICLLLLLSVGLLVAPQVLGVRFTSLPNFAFAGGSILTFDQGVYDAYLEKRDAMDTQVFFPGVTVDGVDLSGMTMEQARSAVESVPAEGGGEFNVTVNIGGNSWGIDSGMVPMTRNTEEMLQKAWALGRQNTSTIRNTRQTPLEERWQAKNVLAQSHVALSTAMSYDASAVRALTDQIAERVNVEPVSSEVTAFDLTNKTFSFTDDQSGVFLSADELYNQVMAKINGDPYSSVVMEPETVIAPMTKAELMNSLCRISTYSTSTTSNSGRNTNIELSASAINGMVVQPGETFSFNQATGQRTAAKGYKEATAISGGATRPEVGGGVCQTSSTLFNAVARANLEIVYRSPHAWPSSYVKEGMDATVNWPDLDFKFRNNTDWPVYIVAWYSNRKVTVELYGMSLGDGVTIDLENKCIKTLPAPKEVKEVQNTSLPKGTRQTKVKARSGSVWETYQVWYQNGQEIRRELLCTSTYKAYQETIEYN